MHSLSGKTFASGNNNTCHDFQSQDVAVADFIAWLHDNKTTLANNEERIRRQVIDGLAFHLKYKILQGYSLQEAGDNYVRAVKPRMPCAMFDAVRDALLEMGWAEKDRGQK